MSIDKRLSICHVLVPNTLLCTYDFIFTILLRVWPASMCGVRFVDHPAATRAKLGDFLAKTLPTVVDYNVNDTVMS